MTNINCSKNCIYQKDGKCSYHIVCMTQILNNLNSDCAYFVSSDSFDNKKNQKP